MAKNLKDIELALNQPLFVYQQPMFMLTVSVVLIEENGIVLLEDAREMAIDPIDPNRHPDNLIRYRFPWGLVKAGQETIQFSAVRQVKDQTGIVLKKDALIPVDFRSSPERSKEGNVVDIGMVCVIDRDIRDYKGAKWLSLDFENKCLDREDYIDYTFYMDHDILLERAIDVVMMMKEWIY